MEFVSANPLPTALLGQKETEESEAANRLLSDRDGAGASWTLCTGWPCGIKSSRCPYCASGAFYIPTEFILARRAAPCNPQNS